MMFGYLIDVENVRHGIVYIDESKDRLDQYYRLIGCDCIDIQVAHVPGSGKAYNIVCDDEALLKDNPIVSAAYAKSRKPWLFGNLIVLVMNDDDGGLCSLTRRDARVINESIALTVDVRRTLHSPVLMIVR